MVVGGSLNTCRLSGAGTLSTFAESLQSLELVRDLIELGPACAGIWHSLCAEFFHPRICTVKGTLVNECNDEWLLKKSILLKTAEISGIENVYPRCERRL